nr:hypothetical protein [Propioniciclava coleopterorum]
MTPGVAFGGRPVRGPGLLLGAALDVLPGADRQDGRGEHHDEPDDADDPAELHAGQQGHHADDEAEAREGGSAAMKGTRSIPPQRIGELGILGCKGRSQLVEQSLLVLGQCHRASLRRWGYPGCGPKCKRRKCQTEP